MSIPTEIGAFIGSTIGKTAAYGVHVACRTATSTGEFGTAMYNGAVDSYLDKADELRARREAIATEAPLVNARRTKKLTAA